MRLYQVPNLFQLEDINVTILESPEANTAGLNANNLLESLDHRSVTLGQRPYKAGCIKEFYETCFATNRNKLKTTNELGQLVDSGIYVLGFDLGASKFQHSVLVVQNIFA